MNGNEKSGNQVVFSVMKKTPYKWTGITKPQFGILRIKRKFSESLAHEKDGLIFKQKTALLKTT